MKVSGYLGHTLVVASQQMASLMKRATKAAACDGKVLITGESGVGKDLVARHIHNHSVRTGHAFVAVNCAGLTESLIESELFGHMKGSFTGAYRDQPGKLQTAHLGTLFLDEVGEMSLRMQALLLRFLENGEIQAVGSSRPATTVDVRLICATNRNLPELIAAGQFREDLLYRLRVIHLEVPPLRDRHDDIRALIAHFVGRTGRRISVSDEALRVLERYSWPGNVRELQNVIEQAAWLTEGETIGVEHFPNPIRMTGPLVVPARERRRQVADELYHALVTAEYAFWQDVYPLFLSRDITRHDVRELVRRGLADTRGNYRALLELFGLSGHAYKRFLNFLAAHDCGADFREFRSGLPHTPRQASPVLARSRMAKVSDPKKQPLTDTGT